MTCTVHNASRAVRDSVGRYATTVFVAQLREIPRSMEAALARELPAKQVDMTQANLQHKRYAEAVRTALGPGGSITEVVADDAHPDCVFIEDTAVVLGSTAVVTRPGHESRRGETVAVAEALSRVERLSVRQVHIFPEIGGASPKAPTRAMPCYIQSDSTGVRRHVCRTSIFPLDSRRQTQIHQ